VLRLAPKTILVEEEHMQKLFLTTILIFVLSTVLAGRGDDDGKKTSTPTRPVITPQNITKLERLRTSDPGPLYDIALTEDGETLVAIARNGLALYKAADLTPLKVMPYEQTPFPSGGPVFLDLRPTLGATIQGTTASFVYEDQRWFIDIHTGEQRSEPVPEGYESSDTPVISPDGQWHIVYGRDPQTLEKIFTVLNDTTDAQYDLTLALCGGHTSGFTAVFHPDGTRLYTATGPQNGVISAWNLATGEISATRGGFGPEVWDMVLLPATHTVLVVQGEPNVERQVMFCPGERNPNTGVFAYDLDSGTSSQLDLPGVLYPYQIAASANGRVLLVSDYEVLTLWENGKQVGRHEFDDTADQSSVSPAKYLDYALSPDGQYIAALHFTGVVVWDREALSSENATISPRLEFKYDYPDQMFYYYYESLRFQNLMAFDGSRLMFTDINAVHVFDAASGEAQADLELPPWVFSMTVAGHTLAVQTAWEDFMTDMLNQGEPLSGEEIAELRERYKLTDSTPAIKVFRLGDGEPDLLGEIQVATQDWLVLNPDASLVVIDDYDNAEEQFWTRFYDASTGALLHSIETRVTVPPVFSGDGTVLVIPSSAPRYGLEFWGIPEE
jgi:WD40 repeat protein